MSQYQPPLGDIKFLLNQVFPLAAHMDACQQDLDLDTALAVIEEAGKLASGCIDPINRTGDQEGAQWVDSRVTTPSGYQEAYLAFCEGGWQGLRFPASYGGQELSKVVATLVEEMWFASSLSFSMCPSLTNGAIEALLTAGSEELKSRYLPKLVSGEWSGTMNLTEPQAGSDLAAIQAKAVPQADGTYRLSGQKIFISYGEHDLTENIVHLVLARIPGAPPGVKGISLFVVPKFLLNPDGTPGARNDVRCASIEHKLGIRASPTAVMLYGEKDGAAGYLVGQENRGLEYMFIMMNDARFAVGLQGLAIAERAYQHALWYARQRIQGKPVGEEGSEGATILRHPDIRRLMLSMKSKIEAMRALAVYVAMQKEVAHCASSDEGRRLAQARAELLTPVMKGWLTETCQDVTYDALQVFGGMGFIEETGAAQYYRDARIITIYEGTTAIQANDIVGRKTLRDKGAAARSLLDSIAGTTRQLQARGQAAATALAERLGGACDVLRASIDWILANGATKPRAVYSGAVPYLELWSIVCGGWMHGLRLLALEGSGLDAEEIAARTASAEFFAEHQLALAPKLATAISRGSCAALDYPDAQW